MSDDKSYWKYCPQCGGKLPEEAVYCPFCGNPITSVPREIKKIKLMKTYLILAGLGLMIFILAYIVPWLTLSPSGEVRKFSLPQVYGMLLWLMEHPPPTTIFTSPSDIFLIFLPSTFGVIVSIILYPFTIALSLLSIHFRRQSLVAGFLGIMTGLLWFIGVETMKASIVQEAGKQGGVLGRFITAALSWSITAGYGAYLMILGGFVFIVAFYFRETGRKEI